MAFLKYDSLPPKEVEAKQHPWARTILDVNAHRIKYAHNSIENPMYRSKKEKQPSPDRARFTVMGDRVTKEFIYCANLVKGLYKYRWRIFDVPIIRDLNTIEWREVLHDLKLRFGGTVYCLQSSVCVWMDDNIVGGEKELQKLVETKLFYYLCLDYYNEGVAEFARFIRSTSRPFAYMHVSIDNSHIGTLIYMLYADIVPYTCENFLRLCKETKGGYGGTPVHRIVKDGWIQCGGFALKRTPLSCENFIVPFDRRGVLAMANNGRDDDCSTQFFVLLQPAPWMNHKYVAIGQLIEGAATLEKIERVTTWYESPTSKIIIYRCGILNMECHDIRINKGTSQYIDGHTEDLNSVAELLWEHLLEKTFLQAQLRELERMRTLEGEGADTSSQYNETAKVPDENHEFDVEKIEEYNEEEDDSYKHLSLKCLSPVVKPVRPYYIPLTDVPYPGDVESDFDLKKFLKGDYCLKSDLSPTKYLLAAFPSELWQESEFSSSTSEELSIDSEEQEELERYIKENVDRVSFAGEVVKSITQDKKDAEYDRKASIPDEKLRKLRLASAKHVDRIRHKTKVSVMAPGGLNPERHSQLQRRPTGFVRPEDLAKLKHMYGDDNDDDDDDDSMDERDEAKGTGIKFNQPDKKAGTSQPIARRLTTYVKSTHVDDDDDSSDEDDVEMIEEESLPKSKKESVLWKLYDSVKLDHDYGPTLKNYIPTAEIQHRNLLELTRYTPLFEAKEIRHECRRQVPLKTGRSFEHNLRYGHRMSRKISDDNVATKEFYENMDRSIRSVEYAKKRPTISVSDYQLENLRYQEQLKRKASLGSSYHETSIIKK